MHTNVQLVGWAQHNQPKSEPHPRDVMGLMATVARKAADTLKDPDFLAQLDGIFVVRSLSTFYADPAKELARKLGASQALTVSSGVGGNSPQPLINQAAARIARGELKRVLVVGAETYVPRKESVSPSGNALMKGIPDHYQGDDARGATDLEQAHGMSQPIHGFPLFETALWHDSGLPLDQYLRRVGDLWSGFSAVAQDHPHAWSPRFRSCEEIITPGPANRPIAFPYTKFMNAFVTVDQAAAILLTPADIAPNYAPDRTAPVYFAGGGYAQDRQRFMIDKTDFTVSHPLKAAAHKALNRAGMALDELQCFDLYSCFPCAVSVARKMLNISSDDPRPLTLTGGLGFFGGPGNNYNLHAVATLAEHIAQGNRDNGMVTALGWFMHKHAAGIYTNTLPQRDLTTMDIEDQAQPLAGPEPEIVDPDPTGDGTIETYTLVYTPDHRLDYALIYGRTQRGLRFIANTPRDEAIFQHLCNSDCVGRRVRLSKGQSPLGNTARLI